MGSLTGATKHNAVKTAPAGVRGRSGQRLDPTLEDPESAGP
jgi:hypothetical protein